MQLCLTMSRAAKLYLLMSLWAAWTPPPATTFCTTMQLPEDAALMLSTPHIGDIEKVLDEVILLQDGRSCARPPSTSCARKQGERGRYFGRFTNADESFTL